MILVETVAALQAASRKWRAAGDSVALVPTMGALHEGHLALVRAAREGNDRVIVSIFVNPLQFGAGEDLDAYPRTFDADRELLESAGVDALFHPSVEEMYPSGSDTRVTPGAVAVPLEGQYRPGHFAGVATVVARLLGAAIPDRAYFGQKDAQQLAVVRAMVRDLAIPVQIVGCPTVRDADGLALSSRNRYLSPAQRAEALAIPAALHAGQQRFAAGETDPQALQTAMLEVLAGLEVDYAAVADPDTFAVPAEAGPNSLLLVAACAGGTRLIDNTTAGGAAAWNA